MASITIDPGHGGIDSGAVGPTGLKEADVNLKVTLQVAQLLQNAGIKTVLTRDAPGVSWSQNKPYSDLHGRTVIANAAKTDIFLSIHCNADGKTSHGTETFCYKFGGQGEKLARCIQIEVIKAIGLTDRGVKEGNLQVLRDTDMPAALIEMAFISNPAEERLLAESEAQTKLARAITQGVCDYFNVAFVQGPRMVYGAGHIEGRIIDDRLYVRATEVAELFGHNEYSWDQASKTMEVK